MQRYRFMFTPIGERASALEARLEHLQEEMIQVHDITEISPIGKPSQASVWVCGRICKDADEGKINSTSILLQSGLKSSGGGVSLNLTEISSYSLFPGQIVLVEGINPSGREIFVKNIIEGIPRPLPKSNPEKLLEFHHSNRYQSSSGLNIIVASGPFTTSDNLSYEPFTELLQQIIETTPDFTWKNK